MKKIRFENGFKNAYKTCVTSLKNIILQTKYFEFFQKWEVKKVKKKKFEEKKLRFEIGFKNIYKICVTSLKKFFFQITQKFYFFSSKNGG